MAELDTTQVAFDFSALSNGWGVPLSLFNSAIPLPGRAQLGPDKIAVSYGEDIINDNAPLNRNTRSYGRDEEGNFNASSKAYKENPSIENYVRLRRLNPEDEIEVTVVEASLDAMLPELKKYGIDAPLFAGLFDGDPDSISEVSLLLMERLVERKELSKTGGTHLIRRGLAIPDKLVNYLIALMLDGLGWNDWLYIPGDLIVLVRERLGDCVHAYRKEAELYERPTEVIGAIAKLWNSGIPPTISLVAKELGYPTSTVMRWFGPGQLAKALTDLARCMPQSENLATRNQFHHPVGRRQAKKSLHAK
jgi:hypothetical protein